MTYTISEFLYRFSDAYRNMNLKIAAALLPCFKLDWVDDEGEKSKITE